MDAIRDALIHQLIESALDSNASGRPEASLADIALKLRAALAAQPAASGEAPSVETLLAQARELARVTAERPGQAVAIPELLSTEGRKFMRGEPSLFDRAPLGDLQEVGGAMSACPHGVPHRWPCAECDAAPTPAQPTPEPDETLWLWQNGDHFLAFRNLYPCFSPGGDPMTLGEPFGRAIFKQSHNREGKPNEQQRTDRQSQRSGADADVQRRHAASTGQAHSVGAGSSLGHGERQIAPQGGWGAGDNSARPQSVPDVAGAAGVLAAGRNVAQGVRAPTPSQQAALQRLTAESEAMGLYEPSADQQEYAARVMRSAPAQPGVVFDTHRVEPATALPAEPAAQSLLDAADYLVTGENMRRDGYMLYRSVGERFNVRSDDLLRLVSSALAAHLPVAPEPDMRHPKIQRLIGAKARREIELGLVEQLLEDPECDLTSLDMEYWGPMHDRLKAALTARKP